MMKMIQNVMPVLACVMCPALCMAEGYNYDDDTNINVSEDEWTNPGGSVNVEIDSGVSCIVDINNGTVENQLRITVQNGRVVINAVNECVVPIFRIDGSAVQFQKLNRGMNTIDMPAGVYIIAGKKYRL